MSYGKSYFHAPHFHTAVDVASMALIDGSMRRVNVVISSNPNRSKLNDGTIDLELSNVMFFVNVYTFGHFQKNMFIKNIFFLKFEISTKSFAFQVRQTVT